MASKSFAFPVAVVGAGPIGLAAAAHLATREIPFVVLEAGDRVGHHLAGYRHVRLFSPWRFNQDRAAARLLESAGWTAPEPDKLPTAGDVVDQYLAPLAGIPGIAPHVRLNSRVVSISRLRHDKAKTANREAVPFVLQVESNGQIEEIYASAVLDASGTWSTPNPIGTHGMPAIGERENAARITYGMPDITGEPGRRYRDRRVLVVGAGHSAIGNLVALATLAAKWPETRIVWALRRTDLRGVFGGGENDGLPARGALGTQLRQLIDDGRLDVHRGFFVHRIESASNGLRIVSDDPMAQVIEGIDEIIVATGSRPDLGIARELRLRFDPLLESTDALAPLIDPNVHSCGTVRPHGHRELQHPEPGFYAIGAKSYGRAPNFLMATGYEQARSVVAALAGDLAAADDVQLELPETGVCSTDFQVDDGGRIVDCCGGPPKESATACCVADEVEKAKGETGCGCSTPARPTPPRKAATFPAIRIATEPAACCSTSK